MLQFCIEKESPSHNINQTQASSHDCHSTVSFFSSHDVPIYARFHHAHPLHSKHSSACARVHRHCQPSADHHSQTSSSQPASYLHRLLQSPFRNRVHRPPHKLRGKLHRHSRRKLRHRRLPLRQLHRHRPLRLEPVSPLPPCTPSPPLTPPSEIRQDCTGLQAYIPVCIGVPGYTYPGPLGDVFGGSKRTAGRTPVPIQPGIVASCGAFQYTDTTGQKPFATLLRENRLTQQQWNEWNWPGEDSKANWPVFAGYWSCIGLKQG
ncbi:hypothetical protein PMIN02_006960 [Paraphaeosphaeria minitans]